jgi:hypothetical protein
MTSTIFDGSRYMKQYTLKITATPPTDWSGVEKAHVDSFTWGDGTSSPKMYGQLVYVKNGSEENGLYVHLFCDEKHPVSVETKPDGMVWLDSCMEFFFSLHDAGVEDNRFVNFECNSLGVSYIGFGIVGDRVFLRDIGVERFPVQVSIEEDGWHVFTFIPEGDLKKMFDLTDVNEGTVMTGNFNKCDENANAPFGTWSPVYTPQPDFHRPDFFGRIVISR